MAREDTQFKPGNPGGPGRAKGGRAIALGILDGMLSEAGNQELLRQDLQKEFEAGPSKFFQRVVVPLLPKDVTIGAGEGDGGINITLKVVKPKKDESDSPDK